MANDKQIPTTQKLTIEQSSARPGAKPGLKLSKAWPFVAAVASLLAIWQIAAFFMPVYLLPDVPIAIQRLGKIFTSKDFLLGLQTSFISLAIGYPIACILGAVLGLIGGVSKPFAKYLRSLITILQSIPPVTWVPFFLILLGFGMKTSITVITVASFFPMALSVLNGTEGVNRTHTELARVLGVKQSHLLTKVFAPECFPAFMTGAQVSFGNAWRSLISSEMVGGTAIGLGYSISFYGNSADMAGVMACIIVIGSIASFIDHFVLERIKRKLLHYRYVAGGEK